MTHNSNKTKHKATSKRGRVIEAAIERRQSHVSKVLSEARVKRQNLETRKQRLAGLVANTAAHRRRTVSEIGTGVHTSNFSVVGNIQGAMNSGLTASLTARAVKEFVSLDKGTQAVFANKLKFMINGTLKPQEIIVDEDNKLYQFNFGKGIRVIADKTSIGYAVVKINSKEKN